MHESNEENFTELIAEILAELVLETIAAKKDLATLFNNNYEQLSINSKNKNNGKRNQQQ